MTTALLCLLLYAPGADESEKPTGAAVYDVLPEGRREHFVEAWRRAGAAKLREIATARRSIRAQPNRRARQAVLKRIEELEEDLEQLKKNDPPFIPSLPEQFEVGAVGTYRYRAKVLQILDDGQMLVEFGSDLRGGNGVHLVRGFATKEFVDGDRVRFAEPLEIVGTSQYTTVLGGTKTVYEIQPFQWPQKDESGND